MKRKKLGLIEKLLLRWQAKKDTVNNQFKDYETLVSLMEEDILPAGHPWENHPKLAIKLSPFVLTELRCFRLERAEFYRKTKYRVNVTENAAKKMEVIDALCALDNRIEGLRREADQSAVDVALMINNTREAMEKETRRQYVAKYQNELKHLEGKMDSLIRSRDKETYRLLNEKMKIFRKMEAKLEVGFERHLYRIHYYFQNSAMNSQELPMEILRNEILLLLGGRNVMGSYQKEYDQVKAKLSSIGEVE